MPDEDIMDQLKKIDEDEILGEEVNFDDDLDFEGLDDMDNLSADIEIASPAVAPPAPQARAAAPDEAKSEKPTAKKSSVRAKPSEKATTKPAKETSPKSAAQVKTSVTEVDEVVVRAKVLRIVADRVIIEPGDNISFSSS